MCQIAEMCVLMHELGHMALGHLGRPDMTVTPVIADADVLGFAHQKELEADVFAVQRVHELAHGSLRLEDVIYAFGMLLVLAHAHDQLVGRIDITTHPEAMVRWDSVYALLGEQPRDAPIRRLDNLMHVLAAEAIQDPGRA